VPARMMVDLPLSGSRQEAVASAPRTSLSAYISEPVPKVLRCENIDPHSLLRGEEPCEYARAVRVRPAARMRVMAAAFKACSVVVRRRCQRGVAAPKTGMVCVRGTPVRCAARRWRARLSPTLLIDVVLPPGSSPSSAEHTPSHWQPRLFPRHSAACGNVS